MGHVLYDCFQECVTLFKAGVRQVALRHLLQLQLRHGTLNNVIIDRSNDVLHRFRGRRDLFPPLASGGSDWRRNQTEASILRGPVTDGRIDRSQWWRTLHCTGLRVDVEVAATV